MDLYGHVNNLAYLRYMQTARIGLCHILGLRTTPGDGPVGFTVASVSCNFKKELMFPGEVMIETAVVHIGNSSFQLRHNMGHENGEIAAIGRDVLVLWDYGLKSKKQINEGLREKMKKHFEQDQKQ